MLLDWIEKRRKNLGGVLRLSLRTEAKRRSREILGQNTDFKASPGWCTRFMQRHDLVIRLKTKISQKLPDQLREELNDFQSFVYRQRTENSFDLACIANMDETPMQSDMPSSRTIESKGAKTVQIRTTGNEKNGFTLVLTCMADGTKLKPMLIFKRKTRPKGNSQVVW